MEAKTKAIIITKDDLQPHNGDYFDIASRKEWLVTDGLGGYAAGTLIGANTRRYHGLLVVALHPPVERTVLISKIDTTVCYRNQAYPLFANEFADGTISPGDAPPLATFYLDGLIPVWQYALADARLEQRVWMPHGHNTTYLTYTLSEAGSPASLDLIPLCTYRDYHSHSHGGWDLRIEHVEGGFEVKAFDGAQPYRVVIDQENYTPDPMWYWHFKHRRESFRGLDDTEDLFSPGRFHATLQPGESLTVICSTEPVEPHSGTNALQQERRRQADLLGSQFTGEPDWIKQLVLAADQFIVQRQLSAEENSTQPKAGVSVIAGYPWFSDWGRDTMIALPGLTLATGRPKVAASILRTFAHHISEGMLPNRFPDMGEEPEYNTVDATLWYFHAVHQHLLHTNDLTLAKDLYPKLVDILDWHRRGTRYNIRVDPDDGLLYAGEPGLQLTWMDAKVGDWVVTPRIGKPVEVNALWHNALRVMADLSKRLEETDAAAQYQAQADRTAENFRQRFWYAEGGYLFDVIDGPDGKRSDARLRPNQIFAVSLPFQLLTKAQAKAVVNTCADKLWTPLGLRTLTVDDSAYQGHYGGNQVERDGAYHQGTVWGWLLGPFVTAHYRVYGDAARARSFLAGMEDHVRDGCVGSISEIFDGDPPHAPRGCFAQAWSVSEVLRAWQIVL